MFRSMAEVSGCARCLMGLGMVVTLGACADSSLTAPEGSTPFAPAVADNVVVDPLDLATETHAFDDLAPNCAFGDSIPNPYEGLQFLGTPFYAACPSPNGTVALIPSFESGFGSITEILIDLPRAADAASLDVYDLFTDRDLTLNAYDASGALVASASDPTDGAWVTLSVTGDIRRLGIATDQGNTFLDNLSITYAPEAAGDAPTETDACKKGGWTAFGFDNQGQCVRFVQTGKDAR